jgi:hypothetical protein
MYTFTNDIAQWMQDNARAIAEHLWCPNLSTGWKAWIYVDGDEIKCTYNTQNTAPRDEESGDFLILPVWTEVEDEGSPFDADYTEVDYIADYISQGSMDIQAGACV